MTDWFEATLSTFPGLDVSRQRISLDQFAVEVSRECK